MTIEAYFGVAIIVYLLQVLDQDTASYVSFGSKINVKTMGSAYLFMNLFMALLSLIWLPIAIGFILIRSWKLFRNKPND